MNQYVFSFKTDEQNPSMWEEVIFAGGMMEAFLKAKQLRKRYIQEKKVAVHVEYKGVRYYNVDIA